MPKTTYKVPKQNATTAFIAMVTLQDD